MWADTKRRQTTTHYKTPQLSPALNLTNNRQLLTGESSADADYF